MGRRAGAGACRRDPARRTRALRGRRAGGGARVLSEGLLIREVPATELTLATRVLAHLGALPSGGRVALRVGSDVVYVGGRLVASEVVTPYDLAAVRLRDGLVLAGDPPEDLERYLEALRADPSAAAAASHGDAVVTAAALGPLVERLTELDWGAALERTRSLGGLVGAYPAETA